MQTEENCVNTIEFKDAKIFGGSYLKFPTVLLSDWRFNKLSNDAKILYMALFSALEESCLYYSDEESDKVAIIISSREIAELLKCSDVTARKVLNDLCDVGLAEKATASIRRGRPNRIFLKKIPYNN